MWRITWVSLLLLLLVFQIALDERSDSWLLSSSTGTRNAWCVLVVDMVVDANSGWWLWLAVIASLTILITGSLTATYLPQIEVVAALSSWAFWKLAPILSKVRCARSGVRLMRIHNACTWLRNNLAFFLIRWMFKLISFFSLLILRMWSSNCCLCQSLVWPRVEIL